MTKNVGYKPKPTYRCKQDELYAVYLKAWNSCKNKITDFALLKALYTLQLIANMIVALTNAMRIPDAQSRINSAEYLRLTLVEKSKQCFSNWQILKLYITQAFPASELKMRLEDAGASMFRQASGYNWEKLSIMMGKGSQFIAAHLAELTANNNMPAAFQTQFNQLISDTTVLYMQYQATMDDITEITTQKINANISLHKNLMLMLKDGQQIYRYDEAKRNEFVFSHILEQVRGVANEYEEFTIPVNNSLKIKKLVANTPFANIGETELVVCNGDVACTPATGISVPAGTAIIMEEGVTAITVLNTSPNKKGYCKTRVIKK